MQKNVLILGHNDATQFVDIYNQYTRLFDKSKYKVTVALLTGKPSEETKQRIIADDVIFLDMSKQKIRTLKIPAVRRLLSLTRQHQYDIVICHRYKPAYIMMAVNKFYRVPKIICVMHELQTMSSIGRKMVARLLAGNNVYFAGVSNAVRDDLRHSLSFLPAERIITLYNCIDVEMTEPHLLSREAARKELELPENAFVFGTIGRLAINKDQKTLITAFATINARHPETKLIILGDGALEDQLKNQVYDCQLKNKVIFTGFVPAGFKYMKAFDCFVLPSIQEAFGRVLIEAMVARLPIIATSVNGIPEVVGHAGILIPPKQPETLSSIMNTIFEKSGNERQTMGDKAYEHVIENYSIPAFQKQFWAIMNNNTTVTT